ncbi:MAG: putative lipid II flippase FtsW [Patescibacteria group bacterium]|nr:putative lipid II flippase FtsW [Patescibacteria group bacterium]
MATLKQAINKLLEPKGGEHESDKNLVVAVGVIVVFGLIMLSSATSAVAYAKFGNSYYYFANQLFGLALGIFAGYSFSRLDYHIWRKYAFAFLIFSIILLLLVFIPGLSATWGRSRSWINIFGFSLQPSEFVKLFYLLYLAAWLESREKKLSDLHQGTGPFAVVLGVIAFLMILQPDVGTLSIIALISLIVYFVGGGKIFHIFVIAIIGVLAFAIMVHYKPYQMDRFRCLVDPSFSRNDICYQVNQSLIAVGSGGIFGRGLGESRQKFMYLPEVMGDSIFPIIAEETGLIISGLLVILYVYIFYRGYLIAKYAPDMFGRILAIGIVSWIVIQAIFNIGGMVNFLPMTGVPLPFISYGGSAIMSSLAAIGILINISKHTKIGIRC